MSNFERHVGAQRGPSFFRGDDGELMFQFVSDPASIVGPRKATATDKTNHVLAFAAFEALEAAAAAAAAAEDEPNELKDLTVPQLKALAEDRNVALGDAKRRADIIAALVAAAAAAA